jgi:hypothetical protein
MVDGAIQHHGKAVLARKSDVPARFQLGVGSAKVRVVSACGTQAYLAGRPLSPVMRRIASGVTVSIGKLGLEPVHLSREFGYASFEL